ncbi:MAG TPA: DUF1569 domain-containing protein [Terracidiphilus sp.]|jgi:hypothetical protein
MKGPPLKSLVKPGCKLEITARLATVGPRSQRLWGRMTAPQMICHLNDSFLGVMGDKAIELPAGFSLWPAFKWIPLYMPMKWPQGVPTRPEVDQFGGGTPPAHFESDIRDLLVSLDKFTAQPRLFQFRPHPIFRVMTDAQWMRWGYLHMDHHLRQFGA